jgi:PAS domain S-box-containing protein
MQCNDSEMAARVRAHDWSTTALGPMEGWPASLKIAVGLCLRSRFPMFVWWGDELINLYNDAYVPLLGARHPDALGRPARSVWREIWPVIAQQVEAVRHGHATWNERVPLTLARNGFSEEGFFTWSYSPIPDEQGRVGGLFCVCTEDTARVHAERERDRLLREVEDERARLAEAFAKSPAFVAVLRGPDHVFETINERCRAIIGPREVIGRPVRHALPEVAAQGILEPLDRVYATGERYVADRCRIVFQPTPDGPSEERFLDFVYEPMRGPDGEVARILAHGVDRTEEAHIVRRDRFLVDLEDAVRPLADPAEVTHTCAAMLGRHLGVSRCAYADVEADGDTFNSIGDYVDGVDSVLGRFRFSDFGPDVRDRMQMESAIVIDDVEARGLDPASVEAHRRLSVRSLVAVPLHKAGRLVGMMSVQTSTPRRWNPADIELVRHVANRCWEAIERLRIERALRESEQRFRTMSDDAPVVIWMSDHDGQTEYVNAQWHEMTGQPTPVRANQWLEAVHPDDRAGARAAFAEAIAQQRPCRTEYRLRRADGEYRWCVDSGTPRYAPSGQFLGMIGSVVDITDRKRGELALATEKSVLELLATGSPVAEVLDAIVRGLEAQSSSGLLASMLIVDETAQRLRHGAGPSLPSRYVELVDGLPLAPIGSCGTAAVERRWVCSLDIEHDPHWRGYEHVALGHGLRACTSAPILASDGRVLGTVAVYYRTPRGPSAHDRELLRSAIHLAGVVLERDDIDRRLRHSLAAEQRARAEAERASRTKDDFLATLSHELRTPLNAILGWSQIVRGKTELPAPLDRAIEVIERNARAQAQIIDDLLDMSAIVSGKVRLDVTRIELADVLYAAVEAGRPSATARGIELACVVDGAEGLVVRGDPGRLQQVLWNLVSNATKFTPKGGRVTVSLDAVDGQARLRVRDTGEGIDPEFLPNVFDRFRQADASSTRRHGGLGLGLSIVRQLVEMHGGAVSVDSEGRGKGATFTVSLPIDSHAAPRASLDAVASSDDGLRGLRVLVVDDDDDARELVERLLSERAAEVGTADCAARALELLDECRFDVIVSDIGMPGEDGLTLLRRVRALPAERGGTTPAIAVTAYARPEDRVMAIRAGFQMHLPKPIDSAELVGLVARLGQARP